MGRLVALCVAIVALTAFAAVAQPAGATGAQSVDNMALTWGAVGSILLGTVTLATTAIGTAVWIVGTIRTIDTNQRVFAAETAARIAEHERRIGDLER